MGGLQAAIDVGLAAAFLAGVLSLLSPCSVMLLPAFFSYSFDASGQLLARTGVFYLGLLTTLVPLGAAAAGIGAFLTEQRTTIGQISGVVLVVLGLWQISGLPLPGRSAGSARGTSAIATYLLGASYGLAGACSGPLLGSVLTFAAFGSGPTYGALLMALYALGMALPLLVLAGLWSTAPRIRQLVRPRPVQLGRLRTTWTHVVSGLVTLVIGVLLIVTEGFTTMGSFGSTDLSYRWEQAASRLSERITDVTFLGLLLVIVAGVGGLRSVILTRRVNGGCCEPPRRRSRCRPRGWRR